MSLAAQRTRTVAKELGFLPQGLEAPGSITVSQLVARGRYPHQSLLSTWSPTDAAVVAETMAVAGVSDLADRPVAVLHDLNQACRFADHLVAMHGGVRRWSCRPRGSGRSSGTWAAATGGGPTRGSGR